MPLPLRDYQIQDLAFMIANPKCGILHDPGCGKTPPVCVYIEYLWRSLGIKSYWQMPKSLLRKNYQELLAFTNLRPEEIVIVDGTPAQRSQQMSSKEAKVFLMGFKRFSDDWAALKNLHPELNAIFIDEVHMGYKSHDSKRSKELFKATKTMPYFVAMSGTLIAGRLDSCYPTIHVIEPRYYANHASFKAQHAITDDFGTVLAWHNHAKLGFIFKKHCIRRTFAEVYGAEAKVTQVELCEMHPKQRKAYEEFEEAAILELDDKFLEGGNPAVAAMRCRQIMAHPHTFKITERGELTGKEERLMIHVEDHLNTGKPFVVFATLQPEQERLRDLLVGAGLRVGFINGDVPAHERSAVDEAFRQGKLDVIVGSPATAAVGYNWGHVDHIIFSSLNYENVDFVQAYRRAIRGVRESNLLITVLEFERSIDQRIFEIVKRKSKDLEKVDSTYETIDLKKTAAESFMEEGAGGSVPKSPADSV